MEQLNWNNLNILVTGATGSFGQKFIEILLKEKKPKKIIVFSRDELKQSQMRQKFPEGPNSNVRYFLGDIRDKDRVNRAFHNVDIVVHAAALKQVPACEYNPFEAVQTNIIGAQNIIDAAINNGVRRIVGLSTDKAVNPINLYGATKLVAEKLFVQGNAYSGDRDTRFSCVRYGNVVGSRGSIVPLFLRQRAQGKITITDLKMTRFWITLEHGVRLVMKAIEHMQGGEIFIPKIPSMRLENFVKTIAPNCEYEIIGIRPGEKLHEVLISSDEVKHTYEFDDMFIISPNEEWTEEKKMRYQGGKRLKESFYYSSDSNTDWLTHNELLALIKNCNLIEEPA